MHFDSAKGSVINPPYFSPIRRGLKLAVYSLRCRSSRLLPPYFSPIRRGLKLILGGEVVSFFPDPFTPAR